MLDMAVRLRRAEQVERNRGAVLEAARQVFIERGYAGASLEAIAEEAGFSKGVGYSQFGSKPELFFALLEYVRRPWFFVRIVWWVVQLCSRCHWFPCRNRDVVTRRLPFRLPFLGCDESLCRIRIT